MKTKSRNLPRANWVNPIKVEAIYPFRKKDKSFGQEYLLFEEIKNGKNIEINTAMIKDIYEHAVDNFLHSRGILKSDERYDEYKDRLNLRFETSIIKYCIHTSRKFGEYLKINLQNELIKIFNQEKKTMSKTIAVDRPFNEERASYVRWEESVGVGLAKDRAEKILSILPNDLKGLLITMAENDFSQVDMARKLGCSRSAISSKICEINRLLDSVRSVHRLKEKGLSIQEISKELNIRAKYINYCLELYDYLNDLGPMPNNKLSPLFSKHKQNATNCLSGRINLEEKGE